MSLLIQRPIQLGSHPPASGNTSLYVFMQTFIRFVCCLPINLLINLPVLLINKYKIQQKKFFFQRNDSSFIII